MEISDAFLAALGKSRHILVFTGAGVSAESDIPTFRDAMDGWNLVAGLAGGGATRIGGKARRDRCSNQSWGNPVGWMGGLQAARQGRGGIACLVGGNAQSRVIFGGSYGSSLEPFPN